MPYPELKNDRLSDTFSHAGVGMALIKSDGTLIDANSSLCKALGYSWKQLEMCSLSAVTIPEDRGLDQGLMKKMESGEIPSYQVNKRYQHGKTGDTVWMTLSMSIGQKLGSGAQVFLAVFQEITSEILKLKELELSNEELESFAYLASHDLQQPLRIIISFTELLVMRYGDQLDGKGRRYIDRVLGSATGAAELIKDLLNYSRAGHSSQSMELVDIGELIRMAAIQEIENESTCEVFKERVVISGFRSELMSLFSNLINNSVKYHKEGRPLHIIIAHEESSPGHHAFTIADNGHGIGADVLGRIFEPFRRFSDQGKKGSGIGLSIVKRAAKHHGGTVECQSSLGVGSVFTVKIVDMKEP